MSYSPTTDSPTHGHCGICHKTRPTQFVSFYLARLRSRDGKDGSIHANLCKSCIHKTFWKFAGKNLLALHLGIFTLFRGLIFLVQNTGNYLKALWKLRAVPE
jgi:hypothetical protein